MCKTPVQYQDTPRVAAQSAASACELSPGISVTFASATPADTLRLISTNLTNMYIRAGFSEQRVNLLLSQFGQFTCSRRLCTAGFTFQTVALTCKEFFFLSLSSFASERCTCFYHECTFRCTGLCRCLLADTTG